jgi:tetratricopeptide (TPR) repeat protein
MESIEAAITYLQSEIERQPQSKAKLLTKIADFYTQKGSWDEAQRYVDQAKLIDPSEAGPWKIQAKIYLNQENTNKKALTLAQEAYLSYSDRNNSDPVGYLERYRIFAKQSKFEEAQMELDKIQQIYPKYPNLHYYRGILYQIMGNYQKSIEELNTELKENPTAVRTLTALGKSLNTVGNNAEALGYLKKAMQIDPRSVEAKVQASTSNQRLKNYTGALALLQAAIALDKGNPNLYRQLGFLYREMGDPQNARNAFKKYLEMEPDASDKAEIQRYI